MRRASAPLLLLASLALTLLVAELAARWFWAPPRTHSEPLQLDPELGFAGIPDYVAAPGAQTPSLRLNHDGFRGRELPTTPRVKGAPGDARRVLFVGDSFALGAALDEPDLMSSRVERALVARGERAEVWNLSAADYGIGQELMLLRRFGARIAPDVVVLTLYPGNDLVNDHEALAYRTHVSPGDMFRPYVWPEAGGQLRVHYRDPLRAALRRHSRLFAGLEQRVLAFGRTHRVPWLDPFAPPEPPTERITRGDAPWEHQEIFRPHPPDDVWEQAWQHGARLLEAFRDATDALSARLLVVVIPDVHQVRRVASDVEMDVLVRRIRGVPLDRLLDWDLPERRLAQTLRALDIRAVFLLPRLRRAESTGRLGYLPDCHLSARGHAVAAQAILEALDGGLPSPELELDGRPVRLPPADVAPLLVEVANSEHWPYRNNAWLPWSPSPDAPPQGARPYQRALVALPVRGDGLLLRGVATATHYPMQLVLELVQGPRRSFRIEEAGPFEVRTRLPSAQLRHSDGYVALRISSPDGSPGGFSSGLVVRELGFPGDAGI